MRDESAAAVSARPTADPQTAREGSRTVTGGRPIESYPPRYDGGRSETGRHGRRDAYAALDLGLFNVQPSEFAKVALALVLAKFFGESLPP